MLPTIGIPRALYFFHHFPFWKSFLQGLGFQVVFSPPTNKVILELGLSACVDGICLPIKAYVGHARALMEQGVERLFVPQIISVSKAEYTCPNLMGLPDLLVQSLPENAVLLSPVLDARKGPRALKACYWRFAAKYAPRAKIKASWQKAEQDQLNFDLKCRRRDNHHSEPKLVLLLLGPRYLTDDPFLNGNLVQQLQRLGARVFTAADAVSGVQRGKIEHLSKPLFWTEARQSLEAVEYFLNKIDGVVSVAPFGCGAQALLSVLVEERVKQNQLPKLELHQDEHTSELGVLTRLEAFCDLLERKKYRHEHHLSSPGQYLYCD